MSQSSFLGPTSGRNVVAGVHAIDGGTINLNFGSSDRQGLAQPRKPFSTVPFPPDPDFVDRADILDWIRKKCATPTRIALVGLGGIGKSQIAIQYAHEVRKASSDTWVFWVPAGSAAGFAETYRNIADRLKLPGREEPGKNVLQLVRDWLCDEENGPWLMILDNADDAEVLFPARNPQTSELNQPLAAFLPKTGLGSILITSRAMGVVERLAGFRNTLTVPIFQKPQAMQLLQQWLGEDCGGDKDAAADLLDTLDYMPLAITQAAAYIKRRSPRMSVAHYLESFRSSDKQRTSLLNSDSGDLRRDESASNSIVTTWQMTFEQVRHERPSAADLLSFMSFFNPQEIPMSVLRAFYEDNLGPVAVAFDEDIEVLRGYSLLAFPSMAGLLEMHPLVQFCMQVWLSSFSDIQPWKQEFLRVMSYEYPQGIYKNWRECQILESHIETMMEDTLREEWDIQSQGGLFKDATWFQRSTGKLVNITSKESIRNWAILLTNAADYRTSKGQYKQAEKMYRRAIEANKMVLGETHLETLRSVNRLASILQDVGNFEESEDLSRRALEMSERVLGEDNPCTHNSLNILALALTHQGKQEEAERMSQRDLQLSTRVLGEDHPDTIVTLTTLASIMIDQGKFAQAEQMHTRVLEAEVRIYGEDNPETFITLSNIAHAVALQGRYDEAQEMHRRVVDLRTKVLGEEHPETLNSIHHLAVNSRRLGRLSEAAGLYEKAYHGHLKALGPDHRRTEKCMSNWRFLIGLMGNEQLERPD